MTVNTIFISQYISPAGGLILGSIRDRLCLCDWLSEKRRETIDRRLCQHLDAIYEAGTSPVINEAIRQLDEYFAGTRSAFDIPLQFAGSEFRCRVWSELLNIPYGQTISYAEQACRIGMPSAFRAVANANAANAISIFVPCHRVIGSNRRLTGYAGGIEAKKTLLDLEARMQI